jgi:Domain of unknown function (DUF4136)
MNFRNPVASCSRAFQIFLLVLLVSLGAQAQKVNVSYDKTIDFSKFKTYAWAPLGAVGHPMLAADVVGAIDEQMKAKGLQLTADNPDLVIHLYGSIDQESSLTSNDPLYMATGGIPPFDPSAFGPALSGTWGNTTITIHKGQLVVDILDVSAKKLVWRGMATDNLSAHDPKKLENQVNNSVVKMFKQYPPGKS